MSNIPKTNKKTGGKRPGSGRKKSLALAAQAASVLELQQEYKLPLDEAIVLVALGVENSNIAWAVMKNPQAVRNLLKEIHGRLRGSDYLQDSQTHTSRTGRLIPEAVSSDSPEDLMMRLEKEIRGTEQEAGYVPHVPNGKKNRASKAGKSEIEMCQFRARIGSLRKYLMRQQQIVTPDGEHADLSKQLEQCACCCDDFQGRHFHCEKCGEPVLPGQFRVYIVWNRRVWESATQTSETQVRSKPLRLELQREIDGASPIICCTRCQESDPRFQAQSGGTLRFSTNKAGKLRTLVDEAKKVSHEE